MFRTRLILIACLACLPATAVADTLAELIRGELSHSDFGPSVLESVDSGHVEHAYQSEASRFLEETSPLRKASMLQRTPLLRSRTTIAPEIGVAVAAPGAVASVSFSMRLFGSGVNRSNLRQAKLGAPVLSVDVVDGAEAAPLASTDLGDLLKKSSAALSTSVQSRSPIVNDARVRSSRIGTLAASGSYWVPARADLDTALNKIDSRQIRDVIVIPGPYSSFYGPGFNFVDFELVTSPRFAGGRETHGATSFDHKSNGNQWFGQQTIMTGAKDWGIRGAYSHRAGSNYRDGDGQSVASSYKSRAFTLALGRDFNAGRSVELSLLRLDQTDVEFPGFVFDINTLVTDGYEMTYFNEDSWLGDQSESEAWYNRTDFNGDSRNPEKTQQFPILARLIFDGTTDADVMSTGYRRALFWQDDARTYRFTLGHDLRLIKQEVNEDFSLLLGLTPVTGNSPLPRSFSVNPGLFASYYETFCEDYTFEAGARLDFVQTDITDDVDSLTDVGVNPPNLPVSYVDTVGTNIVQTDRWLGSLYGKLERRYSPSLSGSISVGYGQRPPTLTELYGAEQLLLVVQNGLNVVTGDPRLKSEKMLQFDVTLDFSRDLIRGGIRGFSGWGFDYITFENTFVRTAGAPPNQVIEQTSLRYVNTDLATIAGFESYIELMPKSRISPFATMRYTDARDRTRNGDFATRPADPFTPSTRFPGLPRGFFSGPGFRGNADSEPLPGIAPLESRIGVRLSDSVTSPECIIELAARIVDNQDRVASSLLEFQTPGFTTWDLRAVWQPSSWDSVTLFTGIENFTDKTYREHLDFQSRSGVNVFQPGASFYFGIDTIY